MSIEIIKDKELWIKVDHFCPECGKKEVWGECGDGDYYCGPSYACLACGCAGTLLPWGKAKGVYYIEVIEQLKQRAKETN